MLPRRPSYRRPTYDVTRVTCLNVSVRVVHSITPYRKPSQSLWSRIISRSGCSVPFVTAGPSGPFVSAAPLVPYNIEIRLFGPLRHHSRRSLWSPSSAINAQPSQSPVPLVPLVPFVSDHSRRSLWSPSSASFFTQAVDVATVR